MFLMSNNCEFTVSHMRRLGTYWFICWSKEYFFRFYLGSEWGGAGQPWGWQTTPEEYPPPFTGMPRLNLFRIFPDTAFSLLLASLPLLESLLPLSKLPALVFLYAYLPAAASAASPLLLVSLLL